MKNLVSHCPIEEVMQVLSGRWPALLIYYLKEGTRRFGDLRRDNPTISHRMLTLELRKLEEAGIVRRTDFAGYPLRVDYDLTPAGHRLVPLIDALGDWWEENAPPDPGGPAVTKNVSARILRVVDSLPLTPGIRVLEVGCGPVLRRATSRGASATERSSRSTAR